MKQRRNSVMINECASKRVSISCLCLLKENVCNLHMAAS